jgi:hypothetical protein
VRCYNGCPDSELQRVLDTRARIRASIQARGLTVTYFPEGEFYQAFDARHRTVTKECRSLEEVAQELGF